jgi:L-fuculose-phosphate aldolase
MTFLNLNHFPDQALRIEIISTALKMNSLGINHGKSGNVSARADNGFLITPTGLAYEKLMPASIVAMAIDNNPDGTFIGDTLPSSEWRFHHDIYAARPDAMAIVHTHSIHATALAVLGQEIPAFHYMVAAGGGNNIRVAAYATFGTQALSDNALLALKDRNACLLAQHGVIACGANLEKALALAVEIEALSHMYLEALKTKLPIPILSEAEMAVVLEKFSTYGQQPGK